MVEHLSGTGMRGVPGDRIVSMRRALRRQEGLTRS